MWLAEEIVRVPLMAYKGPDDPCLVYREVSRKERIPRHGCIAKRRHRSKINSLRLGPGHRRTCSKLYYIVVASDIQIICWDEPAAR